MNSEFQKIRAAKVKEVMDRLPHLPSRTLARILFSECPEMFLSVEQARSSIRHLRGTTGEHHRKQLKDLKYVQSV
jgi:hypothetical protein